MKIGVIGAGFVGQAIGKLAVRAGHEVVVSNSRGPETLFSLPAMTGCKIGTAAEAAAFGDIVVVAVPLLAYRAIPVEPLAGKIVIDTMNYYPQRDGQIAELDRKETTTSELLARHLPASRIVKAFNAVRMVDLEPDSRPAGSPERRALPIAADDAAAKAIVAKLYDAFGYDAVDVGGLSDSWRFQRGTPVYCARMKKDELMSQLAATRREAVPA